ncbi:MAG: hypothetical protein AB8F95_01730 [Bacteroidia bacterium]
MKKALLVSILLSACVMLFAQEKAVTETGKEVVLHEDGTWTYVNKEDIKETEIPVNKKKFQKDKTSSFQVKSSVNENAFFINPKLWEFEKAESEGAVEYKFKRKGQDLYAMAVTERIGIALEQLKTIAITNARAAAPDTKITKEEYRTVNGNKVLMLQMEGTIQGIKFIYFGYYFSNENSTTQFLSYTAKGLFDEYKDEMEVLLNGLTLQ